MKVKIEIECENVKDLQNYLKEISETLEKRSLGHPDCKFDFGTCFADRNKFGDYNVLITPEN